MPTSRTLQDAVDHWARWLHNGTGAMSHLDHDLALIVKEGVFSGVDDPALSKAILDYHSPLTHHVIDQVFNHDVSAINAFVMLRVLLAQGADPNQQDSYGRTVLDQVVVHLQTKPDFTFARSPNTDEDLQTLLDLFFAKGLNPLVETRYTQAHRQELLDRLRPGMGQYLAQKTRPWKEQAELHAQTPQAQASPTRRL